MSAAFYTGDSATGSITDSVTVVTTGKGKAINYAGPASKLGKASGTARGKPSRKPSSNRSRSGQAEPCSTGYSERHMPLEKLAAEVSKVEGLSLPLTGLAEILKDKPADLAAFAGSGEDR